MRLPHHHAPETQKPNEKRDLVRRFRRAVVGSAKREDLHESGPPLSLTELDALTPNWASGIGQIM